MYYKSAGHTYFLHTKPGSSSFCSHSERQNPRGTGIIAAAILQGTTWHTQISKPVQGQPLPEPTGPNASPATDFAEENTWRRKGTELRSNRTGGCRYIHSYTPGKVGNHLWMSIHSRDSVSLTQHRGFHQKCSLACSPSPGALQTDRASPVLATLLNTDHLCHLWPCHLLIKIPQWLHAIWRCHLGLPAQYRTLMSHNVTWLWTSHAGFNWKRNPWDAQFHFCRILTLNPHFLSLGDYSEW